MLSDSEYVIQYILTLLGKLCATSDVFRLISAAKSETGMVNSNNKGADQSIHFCAFSMGKSTYRNVTTRGERRLIGENLFAYTNFIEN